MTTSPAQLYSQRFQPPKKEPANEIGSSALNRDRAKRRPPSVETPGSDR